MSNITTTAISARKARLVARFLRSGGYRITIADVIWLGTPFAVGEYLIPESGDKRETLIRSICVAARFIPEENQTSDQSEA